MSKIFCYICLWCCCTVLAARGQQKSWLQPLTPGPLKSIRGLCVLTDRLLWASGTGGMVGKSTDGGKEWQWTRVSGCDSCDWRAINAFNEKEAVVVNAGEPAHIYRTQDGGATWQQVYYNDTKGIFFDDMEFWNNREGMAIGDPLQDHFMMLRTQDGGKHWDTLPLKQRPAALAGEAIFAASAGNLQTLPGQQAWFITGGAAARSIRLQHGRWQAAPLPILQGAATQGAFAIAVRNAQQAIVVGGDYRNDTLRERNCLLTADGGKTWTQPAVPPQGFRSSVIYINAQTAVATGTSGTDISFDSGRHWELISKEGFHVVQAAKKGKAVFLAGSDGRIAQLVTE